MEQLKRSDKIVAQMGKIAGNRYITAIRNGMSVVIPVTIIGSFFYHCTQFTNRWLGVSDCTICNEFTATDACDD